MKLIVFHFLCRFYDRRGPDQWEICEHEQRQSAATVPRRHCERRRVAVQRGLGGQSSGRTAQTACASQTPVPDRKVQGKGSGPLKPRMSKSPVPDRKVQGKGQTAQTTHAQVKTPVPDRKVQGKGSGPLKPCVRKSNSCPQQKSAR
jgi:hypothetical protein